MPLRCIAAQATQFALSYLEINFATIIIYNCTAMIGIFSGCPNFNSFAGQSHIYFC